MDRVTTQRKRIGVLVGGEMPERELSVAGGDAVRVALEERGWDVVTIHVDRELDLVLRQERIEVAFLCLRSRRGDGAVQGLLETLGIPYTGSSLWACALASDKLKDKELLRLHGLPTPAYYRHSRDMGNAVEQHQGFGFPCVVKPRAGGSGVGVAVARNEDELARAVETALRIDDEVIVERHAAGCEVQVALLDGQVLGVAEIASEGGGLDGAARAMVRTQVPAQVIIPPRLSSERLRGVVTQAVRAHHLFGCEGLTRVDLVVSESGNENVLEVETQPDLAPGSLLPKLAHAAGLPFAELVERLLLDARLHTHRRMRERRGFDLPFSPPDRRAAGTAEPH